MTNYAQTFATKYFSTYKGLPVECWNAICFTCINTFTIGICFFLSLYFVNTQHFSVQIAGLLLSFYGFGTLAGGVIFGKLSDLYPCKNISILCLFAQGSAFFLLSFVDSYFILIPNMFILGFAAYGFKTSNNFWLLNMCVENTSQRFRALSISHVAANLGLGISGISISSIALYGFNPIFWISGVLLFCSAIYLILLKKNSERVLFTKETEQVFQTSKPIQGIILVLVSVFLVGLIIAQLGSTYPLYIQESFPSYGINGVSFLFILDTFLIVIFQAPLTTLINKINKILVIGFGALLMGLGMLVLSYSSLFALAILSCVIWTTGEMLFISTAQLLCYEHGNNKKKGQSLGLFQTIFATSNIIGPSIGGIMYEHWGGNSIWYCSMGIGVFCFCLCCYYSWANTHAAS